MSEDRLSQLLSFADYGESRSVSVLVQGPPKTGKTRFWTTWPDPLVIYADPNRGGLAKYVQPHGPVDPKKILLCENWDVFEQKIMPLVRGRKLPCRTLVIDSLSMLCESKAQSMPEDERNWGRKWRLLKPILHRAINRVTDLTSPGPDGRSYNVVCTVHEADITDDDGRRIRIAPAIPGGVKDEVARMFDAVLVTSAKTEYVGEGKERQKVTRYLLHSTPPTPYHDCGDGLGEEGSDFKRLPPVLDVTGEDIYKLLSNYWRME